MTLAVGSRLGAYELLAAIGAGGMGEVYRARDTKLNRDVALKVLPEVFALDADRLARFKREAQVLASLNHPHIAHIYGLEGLERQEGISAFIVMELVDGEDLAERLRRGRLPVDEASPIARQIAEALEAAHEQGVVHRDLKPANIKLRSDGTVKVLDFGLAKAFEQSSASHSGERSITVSPTITTPAMTQMGMILGTAAYMSPEQAKGRPADKRSDVWSFGCVLFEMLSGKRPFEGEDVSDTLAAVLRAEPDWGALPSEIPTAVRALIQRCLVKDRHQRIGDFSVALFVLGEAASAAPASSGSTVGVAPPIRRSPLRVAFPVLAAVLVTAALVGAAAWKLRPSGPAPQVARFSITLPEVQLTITRQFVAISPDGTQLIYAANNRVFLRSLSEFEPRAISGTEASSTVSNPAFSPDGRSIAFSAEDNAIRRIAVSGGAAVTICASATNPSGITWDATGIVFAQSGGIFRCSPNGSTPEQLATVKDDEQAQGPQMLADGSAVLFAIGRIADGNARWDKAQIVVHTLKSGARKTLVNGGSDPRLLPTGHLLYALGGIVFAVPFDPVRQEVGGGPVPVVEGVRRPNAGATGAAQFSTSRTGTLMYVPGPVETTSAGLSVVIADRAGAVIRLSVPPAPYVHVRASRDGGRLAIGSDDGKEAIVWIYELAGTSSVRRLTIAGHNRFPIWSPDGQRVAYQSDRERDLAIFWQRADGTGPVERLTKPAQGEAHVPESWSPDGKHLLYAVAKGSTFSLWTLTVDDKTAAPYGGIQSANPIGAVFSPDGRWIAYGSSPTAGAATSPNRGVFIQPFPATGAVYPAPRQQVDYHPVWAPKGNELLYVASSSAGQLTSVSVTTQPVVAFGTPVTLPASFTAGTLSRGTRTYDILHDGRFVGLISASEREPSGAPAAPQVRIVLNWFEELKARVPVGR